MLTYLIHFSLRQRALILIMALVIMLAAWKKSTSLPVDVLPDLTKPTVTLLTEAPGLSPEEIEIQVTDRLEKALIGVTNIDRLRSKSDIGLSIVNIEFNWGTDIKDARQYVQERLASIDLPRGVSPYMTPATSLMGNIMLIGLIDPSSEIPPRELRTQADWVVARQLQSIPGIAEVLSMGGGIKQIQVQPDPQRLLAYGVTHAELRTAVANSVRNTNGGYIEGEHQEIMVRNLAMTTDLEKIAQTTIRHDNDLPLAIKDVATVTWGTEPMRGDAGALGHPAVVLSVSKAPGYDTLALTHKLEESLKNIQQTLPGHAELVVLYRQADYIDLSLQNLEHALRDGAIMVALILFLFLFNFRITLITLTAIPLSLGISILVFDLLGLSINSMTLGGFAVAIGMVVDDAIVDVENVYRRLRENAASTHPKPTLQIIAKASAEVRSSIFYATLLIILVFIPLLSLSGVEGRLFAPIAIATIISMAASFLVSLTVIPVLASFLIKPNFSKNKNPSHIAKDPHIIRLLKQTFELAVLRPALHLPFLVMLAGAILLLYGASLYPKMGKNFLPAFREPTTLIATSLSPGTSLQQTNKISHTAMQRLMEIPEVKAVSFRAGRAENGDHIVPVSTVEFDVEYHEGHQRPKDTLDDEVMETMRRIPGTFSARSTPLGDRIGHMLSGVAAKIAVKISGPDLEEIRRLGNEITEIAHRIPGLEEAKPEAQAAIPQLRIEPNFAKLQAYGLTPGELNTQLGDLLGGVELAEIYDGVRTYQLVLRLPPEWREDPEKIAHLYLQTQSGLQAQLKDLAYIRPATGPNVIQRENTRRRLVVTINPTTQNLVDLVDELKKQVAETITLPEGYSISYEGDYKAQAQATQSILFSSALILLVITFLLYTYFRSINFTLQVLLDVPIALTGGIILTSQTLNNVSIATLVGFIAIAGISVRNSIMLVSHYLHLMKHENESFTKKMIVRGTRERLVPVLMTALSAGIALLPLVIDLGFLPFVEPGDPAIAPGKEILNPVAVVIVGGLLSSTLFGLILTPTIFWVFGKKSAEKAILTDAPAAG